MLGDLVFGVLLAVVVGLVLAWKWQLRLWQVVLAIIVLGSTCSAIVALLNGLDVAVPLRPLVVAGSTLALGAMALAVRFYRNPERDPPDGAGVIVSPADGEVLYVHEARGGVLPVVSKHGRSYRLEELTKTSLQCEDAVVIGIGLSLMDVHVNRSPIAGRVTLLRRFPGAFGSLRRPEMVFENERATMLLEGAALELAVVLIASRLVRRIVAYVREGQELLLGERIGMIRFGSQVDLILPTRDDLVVTVTPGSRLSAGQTVVATVSRADELVAEAKVAQ